MIREIMPRLATRYNAPNFFKVMRHVGHCGDLAIHHKGTVGMVELKNHKRAIGAPDKKRFFDSIMINSMCIQWAMMITNHSGVPGFGERGYVTVGTVEFPSCAMPVVFVCNFEQLGEEGIARALEAVTKPLPANSPRWKVETTGTLALRAVMANGDGNPFLHPRGAVF